MKMCTEQSATSVRQRHFSPIGMTKAGKTPAEIRAAIARHEYESIDVEKQ